MQHYEHCYILYVSISNTFSQLNPFLHDSIYIIVHDFATKLNDLKSLYFTLN